MIQQSVHLSEHREHCIYTPEIRNSSQRTKYTSVYLNIPTQMDFFSPCRGFCCITVLPSYAAQETAGPAEALEEVARLHCSMMQCLCRAGIFGFFPPAKK